MGHTFFSIIVTALNPGERLGMTLTSLLAQDYGNYEVIIKDGCSTDGSLCQTGTGAWIPAVCRERQDGRIRVVRQEDKGIYDGMNQALPHIRGEYVLFLNCGDCLYDRSVLGKVADLIGKKEAEEGGKRRVRPWIFYGDQYNELQKSLVRSVPKMTDFACYRNVPCHQVCFYEACLFEERGYDTDYRVRADYEHFLYCIYDRGAQAHAMPVVVARYEGGGFSETAQNRKRSALEHKVITRQYLGRCRSAGYAAAMLLTLAPLRTRIAESPRLSRGYNAVKSALYGRRKEG